MQSLSLLTAQAARLAEGGVWTRWRRGVLKARRGCARGARRRRVSILKSASPRVLKTIEGPQIARSGSERNFSGGEAGVTGVSETSEGLPLRRPGSERVFRRGHGARSEAVEPMRGLQITPSRGVGGDVKPSNDAEEALRRE